MDDLNIGWSENPTPIIKVIGVGGGGGNAVNYMYQQGIHDVDFIICNTDAKALQKSTVRNQIKLGKQTEGLGAGNKPEVGRDAAMDSQEAIRSALDGNTRMVFLTAGMGGGTGTGATPVIAQIAREMDILTVAIVTIPFRFEGTIRFRQALDGIRELRNHVDSLLIINNEKLREMYGNLPVSQAFSHADDILTTAAKGIAELVTIPGKVNVDFADVKTTMKNGGITVMGSAAASGEGRARRAVEEALTSPLLNNNEISGARNILLNITSGTDENEVTMDELGEITDFVTQSVARDASVIWGAGNDERMGNELRVTVVATSFTGNSFPELDLSPAREPIRTVLDIPRAERAASMKAADRVPMEVTQGTINFTVVEKGYSLDDVIEQQPRPEYGQDGTLRARSQGRQELFDIDDLENTPAYIRKQKTQEEPGREAEKSGLALHPGENNSVKIRENNSYFDVVD